jgi:SAM-dependent methyltransferase
LLQEQAELRRKGVAKFGEAAKAMLFTRRLLEQASGREPAAWKARRYKDAGWTEVADLCCGSGGDAIELARAGISVELVDLDPVALELARHNLSSCGHAAVAHSPTELPALPESVSARAFHLDPDRRTSGRDQGEDRWDHGGLSPDMHGIRLLAKRFEAGAVKLSPGAPEGSLDLPGETEFVGVHDELREQIVWTGSLARLGNLTVSEHRDGVWETFSAPKREAEAAFEAAIADAPGAWVFEPVKAMVRSHLFALYGQAKGLRRMDEEIAWMTGETHVATNFLKAYRVLAHAPLKAGTEEALLRECGRSCGAVKKRGVAVVPEKALKGLKGLPGPAAVLSYTRVRDQKWVIITEPAGADGSS